MSKIVCPDCGRDVAMHELETQTVTQPSGFETNYRCPFCRTDFDSVAEML